MIGRYLTVKITIIGSNRNGSTLTIPSTMSIKVSSSLQGITNQVISIPRNQPRSAIEAQSTPLLKIAQAPGTILFHNQHMDLVDFKEEIQIKH